MLRKYTTTHRQSPWKLLAGVLFIALVVLGGCITVTHAHAQESASHPDCGLCVASHLAVQIAAAPPVIVLAPGFTDVEASQPIARPNSVPQFALFSRPPPTGSHRS
jgi:hypothetical protein